jgi:hypothetical protein
MKFTTRLRGLEALRRRLAQLMSAAAVGRRR